MMAKANSVVERDGIVIGAHAGLARIRLEPAPGCSGCGSRGTCASAAGKQQIVEIRLPEPAPPGARVTLTLPESSVAVAAVLGYLLPIVGLLLGAVNATLVFAGDLAAVIGAVCGLLVGLLGVRLISGRFSTRYMTPGVCPSPLPTGDHA